MTGPLCNLIFITYKQGICKAGFLTKTPYEDIRLELKRECNSIGLNKIGYTSIDSLVSLN